MIEKEAINLLRKLEDDAESSHIEADEILLNFLRDNGYLEIANEWEAACERIGFWYA